MIYRHIVIPLDGSQLAECVFSYIDGFNLGTQTKIDLIRVVPPLEVPYKPAVTLDTGEEVKLNEFALQEEWEYLKKARAKLANLPADITTQAFPGQPAEGIADYLKTRGADLLIMATHGRSGPSRWIWGSTAEKLLRSTRLPVFLVRPPGCGE